MENRMDNQCGQVHLKVAKKKERSCECSLTRSFFPFFSNPGSIFCLLFYLLSNQNHGQLSLIMPATVLPAKLRQDSSRLSVRTVSYTRRKQRARLTITIQKKNPPHRATLPLHAHVPHTGQQQAHFRNDKRMLRLVQSAGEYTENTCYFFDFDFHPSANTHC